MHTLLREVEVERNHETVQEPAHQFLTSLVRCSDILPNDVVEDLAAHFDLEPGRVFTYGRAARELLARPR